jgi:hypothetical protein
MIIASLVIRVRGTERAELLQLGLWMIGMICGVFLGRCHAVYVKSWDKMIRE